MAIHQQKKGTSVKRWLLIGSGGLLLAAVAGYTSTSDKNLTGGTQDKNCIETQDASSFLQSLVVHTAQAVGFREPHDAVLHPEAHDDPHDKVHEPSISKVVDTDLLGDSLEPVEHGHGSSELQKGDTHRFAVPPGYSPNKYIDRQILDIDAVFNGSQLTGKRVLVTGANRGLGLGLARQLAKDGAFVVGTCRASSVELDAVLASGQHQILAGVDVTSDSDVAEMAAKVNGNVDILVNNAGYYYEGSETLEKLNPKEDFLMFDICAEGPLRVTKALRAAGKLQNGSKVLTITSQAGSITWMSQFENKDYGHHMSKAAANMGVAVLAGELKPYGISVNALHPGFVETDMTARFSDAYASGGAVDIDTAAKRVLHQANLASMRTTGSFVNCEDGLVIPW